MSQLAANYYSEEEMAGLLRVSINTLKDRRSRGTEHPPYVQLRRGLVMYPKDNFLEWVRTRPLVYEVKSSA